MQITKKITHYGVNRYHGIISNFYKDTFSLCYVVLLLSFLVALLWNINYYNINKTHFLS